MHIYPNLMHTSQFMLSFIVFLCIIIQLTEFLLKQSYYYGELGFARDFIIPNYANNVYK
jgi:hypothetical protein